MTALGKLSDALKAIKETVRQLNELLEKTATLAGDSAEAIRKMRPQSATGPARPRSNVSGKATPSNNQDPTVAAQQFFRQYRSPIGPKPPTPGSQFFRQYRSPIGPKPSSSRSQGKTYADYMAQRLIADSYRKRYNAQFAPKPTNPFVNALMRSRVDASGNVMPLVMDLVRLIPAAYRLPLLAVVAALKISNQYLKELRTVAVTGGMGGSGAVLRTSAALGANVAGLGHNLMSGFGPMYASMAGVNPLGAPFGDNDYNRKVIKLLQLIASQKSFNQARAIAEALGSPEAANFWLLSRATQKQLTSSQGTDSIQNIKAQTEAQAQLAIAWQHFAQNLSDLTAPLLQTFSMNLQMVNAIAQFGTKLNPYLWVLRELTAGLQGIQNLLSGEKWDSHQNALDRNTQSLDNLQRSINQGIFGGGPRAQSAPTEASKQPGYWQRNPTMTPYGVLP